MGPMLRYFWGVQIEAPHYHPIISKSRSTKRGGGVAFYLKSNFKFEVLNSLSEFIEGQFESLFIKVHLDKNKFKILGNIYKPPNSNIKLFNTIFFKILGKLEAEYKNAEEIMVEVFTCVHNSIQLA